ncbi:uncharacterized protein YycO [Anaerobacterium chartisolvens]|uniref:Uncharacterized protein YycO n=1 Tax=Anaerobacterium chartisolvens TaxID=1297424 RepID=A0A369AUC4_9FIRM|nr:YiiX/YebB-like N1pC/P60 family cysteine hydrolase [Anaerobacterium chartisolvens]RCX12982.1 uncharacterized protein YycO [Anaerobacterium chartisolvens]
MKKNLVASLILAVLISVNLSCLNVSAASLSGDFLGSDYITARNMQSIINDLKKSLKSPIEAYEIVKGLSDILKSPTTTYKAVKELADVLKSPKTTREVAEELIDTLKFQIDIEKNWDNLKVEKDMDLYNSPGRYVGKPGDILIAAVDPDNPDIEAIKMGSLTSHAAMVDKDPQKVLEVMPGGIQNAENDWKTRYKKILVLRPKTNEGTIKGAIEYGHSKLGLPFNFNFLDKTRTDKFYCSQYVWRCFIEKGLDLDRNGGKAVAPYDFISDKVTIVYKQGR